MTSPFSHEVALLGLIFALMVVPRLLQRWRLPAPLTSFTLGMAASLMLAESGQDATLGLLATLGISSLFLFAGLEVDLRDFQRGRWPLVRHVVIRLLVIGGAAYALMGYFGFTWRVATLLSLALFTPSAGFILDTLPALKLTEDERFWVRMKAISGELLALVLLFVVLQSSSVETFLGSSVALAAMAVGLPLLLLALGRYVVPYARGSEFSLLVMVGVISAYLSYLIGVYYLVGAFLAGFVARLLHRRLPTLASGDNLHAVRMFASFFVPFYFFYKGMGVPRDALTPQALWLGLGLTVIVIPFRIGLQWLQRRLIAGETAMGSLRVAVALSPTLIFTLVLAGIARERFGISDQFYAALLVYAACATILPSLFMARGVELDIDMLPNTRFGQEEDAPTTGERAR